LEFSNAIHGNSVTAVGTITHPSFGFLTAVLASTLQLGVEWLDDGGLDLLNSCVCYVQKVEEEKEERSPIL
jgi:hypothetical protein